MSAAAYTGHAGDGGLQGHSLGTEYPYTIMVVQRYGDLSLADRGGVEVPNQHVVLDCETGATSKDFPTYLAAYTHLWSLKLRNMMHS